MKLYLAILAFLREAEDAFVHDYHVCANDVKHARELVAAESSGKHHMYFEVADIPACWGGYAMEVEFAQDYVSETPLVPVKWLREVVQSGLIHDIGLLEAEDREELYEYFATKLVRATTTVIGDEDERFRFGPFEFFVHFAPDWENLLRLKLAEIEKK